MILFFCPSHYFASFSIPLEHIFLFVFFCLFFNNIIGNKRFTVKLLSKWAYYLSKLMLLSFIMGIHLRCVRVYPSTKPRILIYSFILTQLKWLHIEKLEKNKRNPKLFLCLVTFCYLMLFILIMTFYLSNDWIFYIKYLY